jgi:hypothetical protein
MRTHLSIVFATLAFSMVAFAFPPPPTGQDGIYQIGYAANLNIGDSEINISNDGAQGGFYPNTLGTGNLCVNVYTFDPSEEMVSCCACLVTPNALVSLSAKNDLINDVLTPAIPTSIVIKLLATTPNVLSGASSSQTCAPNGFGGGVAQVILTNGGTGYTAPSVIFTGGGGSGASATAVIAGGVVTGFTDLIAGSGYTSVPTVIINDPTGTAATAVARLENAPAVGMLAWGTTLEPAATAGTYGGLNVPFINGNLSPSEQTALTSVCGLVQAEGTGYGICSSCALGALSGTKQ